MTPGTGVALPDGGSDEGPNSGIGGVPGTGDLNTTTNQTWTMSKVSNIITIISDLQVFHLTGCSGTGVARPDGGSDLGPNAV